MKKKYSGEKLPDRSASRILALSLMNQALHSNHNSRRPNDKESALLQPHPTTTFEFHTYITMAYTCNSIQGNDQLIDGRMFKSTNDRPNFRRLIKVLCEILVSVTMRILHKIVE